MSIINFRRMRCYLLYAYITELIIFKILAVSNVVRWKFYWLKLYTVSAKSIDWLENKIPSIGKHVYGYHFCNRFRIVHAFHQPNFAKRNVDPRNFRHSRIEYFLFNNRPKYLRRFLALIVICFNKT